VKKKTLVSGKQYLITPKEVIEMGEVLKQYPSGSNPAKNYNIILGKDGVVYCDCMGWKMNKHCKHLEAFNSTDGAVPVGAKKAKKESTASLDKTIDEIVEQIKRDGTA
jgi:hypothetical protein